MEIAPLQTSLGKYADNVRDALDGLAQSDVVGRIWRKDYTVWSPQAEQITDRLGWLNVFDCMYEQLGVMQSFARQVKQAGFRHVVLLGVGGSSLGAEVIRQTFGGKSGYPELIVLDSTEPETIKTVTEKIDPVKSLFLVSSKSGTTSEPLLLFRYFWEIVENLVPKDEAGRNFVAITDAGTYLARVAEEKQFRHIFANPADVGGRYSVLTYFGLVPGILTGFDPGRLLERAESMKKRCLPDVVPADNDGAWLGACVAALALRGRDKLTFVISNSARGFGLWVEQLIAESTGKSGKGIIPVSGEPPVGPEFYGQDRLFVYLRLRTDNNLSTDNAVKALQTSGQPVVVLEMADEYDLGAEFFRWEFATAVAGAILNIHPFNQPNVQQAKDATERLLKDFSSLAAHLPSLEGTGLLRDLLTRSGPGKYVAIMAYLPQTPAVDAALTELRQKLLQRYCVATTLGYGPRFLHSTGQIHKGGPNTGLFLQLTARHIARVPIPGLPYTFADVLDAQALGDREALNANGRDVASVRLPAPDADSVRELIPEVC